MGRMTKAERELKMHEALTLSAKGKTVQFIADHLGVAWNTASALIDDAIANRGEHRSSEKDRETAIVHYQAIIRAAWETFDIVYKRSPNAAVGFLNTSLSAQERIDKLTGAEAPVKYQDVSEEYDVVWDESPVDADSIPAGD